ncbi:MAG: ABC transporter ATP-binding protein [Proteobacteria bacterium]|nr:ABC transporter ATP-binding protein [Pseudomonadota bacterium]
MALIEVRGAGKLYRTNGFATHALHPTDLTVGAGEFACVAGPSGSGKTTLLNLVGVLDEPTVGEIRIAGIATRGLSRGRAAAFRRENLGFVFQAYNLVPVLSAWENVEYLLLLQGVAAVERRRRVAEVLERVGLAPSAHKRPGALSGGEQQRVAVARAVVAAPPIVLADEPTSNLDSAAAASLLDLLEGLNREQGITFLFSSHDPRVIGRARRIITLQDGRVAEDRVQATGSTDRGGIG